MVELTIRGKADIGTEAAAAAQPRPPDGWLPGMTRITAADLTLAAELEEQLNGLTLYEKDYRYTGNTTDKICNQ